MIRTEDTADAVTQLLQYCATYRNFVIPFIKSDMILRYHDDVLYLSVSKDRSRAVGFFYLSLAPTSLVANTKLTTESKPTTLTEPMPPLNSAIHVLCTIIKNVMVSTTEANIANVFCSYQDVVPLRQVLILIGICCTKE